MPDPAELRLVAVATEVLDTVFPGGQRQGLNETETRRHAIDPIIEVLGYQSLNHVRREARLSVSGQVVDYLLAAGETQVVVEANQAFACLSAIRRPGSWSATAHRREFAGPAVQWDPLADLRYGSTGQLESEAGRDA